ncbi:uncharacterized protein BX663DRAFT_247512 [Cokeromyces recurvatus]|uniref:uncharacterized protein n=1 Tax=Cokeromyces recurvatus TaxID=90255 RepID=UPI00221F8EC0|nr:uncharacterized protein BX663DRAFT_247512 [Cokeromyces recurvatus]KAI7905979.1 hypothetical protein BX663DRAFT_247512 [Cokeromyces recurvatus]
MKDRSDYKATFKSPKDKYLKFFCEKPASKWSLKNFRKHFKGFSKDPAAVYESTLQKVRNHSKGIPEPILLKIDAQLHMLKNPTSEPTPIYLFIYKMAFFQTFLTVYFRQL